MVGFPEASINLAQAVILLASSPKSNRSYAAYERAMRDMRHGETDPVPARLRDSHYAGADGLGRGGGYMYPHDYGGYVRQQYLPDNLYRAHVKYYDPGENGSEKQFGKFLEEL